MTNKRHPNSGKLVYGHFCYINFWQLFIQYMGWEVQCFSHRPGETFKSWKPWKSTMGEKTAQALQQKEGISLLCPSDHRWSRNDGEGSACALCRQRGRDGRTEEPGGRRSSERPSGHPQSTGSGRGTRLIPQESMYPRSHGRAAAPRARAAPAQGGSLARPLLGERPSAAQGDRTELPQHPRSPQAGGDAATAAHGDTGTRERRPPHLSAAEPPLPTRGENKMAAGEGKRGAQRKEAPRHVTAPARPRMGGPAHFIYIEVGAWRARAPGSRSLTREQQSPLPRGRERCSGTQTRDAALPNA